MVHLLNALSRVLAVACMMQGVLARADVHRAPLDERLERIMGEWNRSGAESAVEMAEELHVPVREVDQQVLVAVLVEHEPGKGGVVVPRLESLGTRVDVTAQDMVRVWVPIPALARMRGVENVRQILAPAVPVPLESMPLPGVDASGLVGLQPLLAKPGTGRGVKVAVVDGGFVGLAESRALGRLPSVVVVDLPGSLDQPMESITDHGTRQAEAVAAVAPNAQLHLIRVVDQVDLAHAVDYVRENRIGVVLHAVGWLGTRLAGDTSGVNQLVQTSRQRDGVLWVVGVGNMARRHWQGSFKDANGNGWLEFSPGVERNALLPAMQPVQVFLTWHNADREHPVDLDLYVRDSQGRVVARSEGEQSGLQPAVEQVGFMPLGSEMPYAVSVRRQSGPVVHVEMDLWSIHHDLGQPVATGSVMEPAQGGGAFTVASVVTAANRSCTSQGEATPDTVLSAKGASATSCGAIHGAATVVGAAALVVEQHPSLLMEPAWLSQRLVQLSQPVKTQDAGNGNGPLPCLLDLECADGDACTADRCMGGTCLHVAQPDCERWVVVASDGFESGKLVGGRGWRGPWRKSGGFSLRADHSPVQGRYHARLLGRGARMERTVELAGTTGARLVFRGRAVGLRPSDRVVVQAVSMDDTVVASRIVTRGDGQDIYREWGLDLSSAASQEGVRLVFTMEAKGKASAFYVDDLAVLGRVPH